jgi:hypothetical protein
VVVCKAFFVYFLILIITAKDFFNTNSRIVFRNWGVGEIKIRLNYGIITKTACSISVVVMDL